MKGNWLWRQFVLSPDEPIYDNRLQDDFYKYSMGRMITERHPDVPVVFSLICRNKDVDLTRILDEGELRAQLDAAREVRTTNTDLHFLRGTNEHAERMFPEGYLEFLRGLRLPEYQLEFRRNEGRIRLEFPGPWGSVTYWEVPALYIVTELVGRHYMRDMSSFEKDRVFTEGIKRLEAKIALLRAHPNVTFSDFGTRRRFSKLWQDYVVQALASELPSTQFRGPSNTYLAAKHGLVPMGTNAHELQMVYACLAKSDEELHDSQQHLLHDWWETYGEPLSIALTDTWGSDFFFRHFTAEQARAWRGYRIDSGDPEQEATKTRDFLQAKGVDPYAKFGVLSDGLTVASGVELAERITHQIMPVTIAPGTNLTNDLGFPPLSLVCKITEANGRSAVKLSNNISKAIGEPDEVTRYKRVFGYASTYNQKPTY